ncbi:MAG: hypothetical protein HGA80_00265 [Candidatus Omnitrophica bacterium]|nr:hypothetical protein [Candidatus Omnitrophota bacterium]
MQIAAFIFLISPKHVSYTDEAMYQAAAKNIMLHGNWGDLQKSFGWVFLIYLGFIFRGLDNYVSIHLSQFLALASTLGFFLLTAWATSSNRVAFIATTLFAFVPARLFWAATGESHSAALFFIIWAMAFSFLFYRYPNSKTFWLAWFFWTYAILVRGETIFLFALFLWGGRLYIPQQHRSGLPFKDALVYLVLTLSPSLIIGTVYSLAHHWTDYGASVSVGNFLNNLVNYGPSFFNGQLHPLPLTVFAFIGLLRMFRIDAQLGKFMAGWLIVVMVVYFSMWFGHYGDTNAFFPKTRS